MFWAWLKQHSADFLVITLGSNIGARNNKKKKKNHFVLYYRDQDCDATQSYLFPPPYNKNVRNTKIYIIFATICHESSYG